MRQLAIIKTGSTMESLARRRGDFEDWILRGMGLSASERQVCVIDVTAGEPLPAYDAVAGVVITGSHNSVTERLPWSERTAAWLPELLTRGVPTLGICFGHQLLAVALGGRVATNPRGRSFGSIDVTLQPAAADANRRTTLRVVNLPDKIDSESRATRIPDKIDSESRATRIPDKIDSESCATRIKRDRSNYWGHPYAAFL